MLKAWRLVALEFWVESAKESAFESLRLAQDVAGRALPFGLKKLRQSIDSTHNTTMNERAVAKRLDVRVCRCNETMKVLKRVLALIGERGLKVYPSFRNDDCKMIQLSCATWHLSPV